MKRRFPLGAGLISAAILLSSSISSSAAWPLSSPSNDLLVVFSFFSSFLAKVFNTLAAKMSLEEEFFCLTGGACGGLGVLIPDKPA